SHDPSTYTHMSNCFIPSCIFTRPPPSTTLFPYTTLFRSERRIDRLSIERSNPARLFRNRTPLSLARCCFRCPDMEKSKKHVLFRKAEACCSAVEVRYATSAEVAADTIGGCSKIHVLDCAKHGASFFDGGDGLRRIALHDHCNYV